MLLKNLKYFDIRTIFFLTFSIVCYSSSVFAATPPNNADPRLIAYSKIKGTSSARNELERIRSEGLIGSPANVKLLREALASRATDEERASQVATLGAMWDHKNTSENNDAIKNDLRKYAQSDERSTARAAVFGLSRMGGVDELKGLLQRAKEKHHIDNDEYAGELARNIRFLTKDRQSEFVGLLGGSKSKYGIDVLTADLVSPSFLSQYSPSALADIELLLGKSEPSFPFAIGEFGHVDALRYAAWLQARAAIYEKRGRGAQAAFVLRTISDPNLDPRKAIGYLSAPEADSFIKAMSREKLEPVAVRIRTYADSLPQNQLIQEFTQLSLLKINTSVNR